MHGLQGAEAQGPTLGRGLLVQRKLYFSNNYLYGSLQQCEQHSIDLVYICLFRLYFHSMNVRLYKFMNELLIKKTKQNKKKTCMLIYF